MTTPHTDVTLLVLGAGGPSGAPVPSEPLEVVALPSDGTLAGAANRAARGARTRYVAFLHADAEPREGWLTPLLEALERRPDASAATSRLLEPAGAVEADGYRFAFASPYPITPVPRNAGAEPGGEDSAQEVPAALAAGIVIRRAAFLEAGGFDERLGFPAAELDLTLRLGERHGPVLCARASVVVHRGTCAGDFDREDAARFTTRWLEPLTRPWLDRVPALAPAERQAPFPRPAVSVIVPTCDALATVAGCVESVLGALGPRDELILSDGGSRDGTVEVLALVERRGGGRVRRLAAGGGLDGALTAGVAAAARSVLLVVPAQAAIPEGFVDGVAGQALDGPVVVPAGDTRAMAARADVLRRLVRIDPGALLGADEERLARAVRLATFRQRSRAGQSEGGDVPLAGKFCGKPWDWFEVSDDGAIRLCCPSWLPTPIGNVLDGDVAAAWNSPEARAIRDSILDGSFRFCVRGDCPYIQSGAMPDRAAVTDPRHRAVLEQGMLTASPPVHFTLSYDESCNLSCPSCRTEKHLLPRSAERIDRIHDRLGAWLFGTPRGDAFTVQMSGAGDPFASRQFRTWLFTVDGKDFPGLRLHLQTNGVMFTRKNWERMSRLHGHLETVWVSFDAATPETYARIRRGGHWDQLQENVQMMDELRRDGLIGHLRVDFVVQQRNFREMPALLEHLRRFPHLDAVSFMLIRDLGTYAGEFADHAIWQEGHPQFGEFLEVLRSPLFDDPRVLLGNMASYRALALSRASGAGAQRATGT